MHQQRYRRWHQQRRDQRVKAHRDAGE